LVQSDSLSVPMTETCSSMSLSPRSLPFSPLVGIFFFFLGLGEHGIVLFQLRLLADGLPVPLVVRFAVLPVAPMPRAEQYACVKILLYSPPPLQGVVLRRVMFPDPGLFFSPPLVTLDTVMTTSPILVWTLYCPEVHFARLKSFPFRFRP